MAIFPSQLLQGSNKCLLLIHGFTGSPYEMMYIAENVHERLGWTVRVPRLPGHATTSEDFMRTGRRDWKRRVIDEYYDMKNYCSEIVVGGLSMGGVLTVILAVEFEVRRILLYAPAFLTVFQKYLPVIFFTSLFVNRVRKKEPLQVIEDDPVRERLRQEYWSYNYYRQSREFFRLQFEGRKSLENFSGKALVVVSRSDSTVPIEVKDYLEKKLGGEKEFLVLERSPHVVVTSEEKEIVLERTLEFLKR